MGEAGSEGHQFGSHRTVYTSRVCGLRKRRTDGRAILKVEPTGLDNTWIWEASQRDESRMLPRIFSVATWMWELMPL